MAERERPVSYGWRGGHLFMFPFVCFCFRLVQKLLRDALGAARKAWLRERDQ